MALGETRGCQIPLNGSARFDISPHDLSGSPAVLLSLRIELCWYY
jgi:hypothetical protein